MRTCASPGSAVPAASSAASGTALSCRASQRACRAARMISAVAARSRAACSLRAAAAAWPAAASSGLTAAATATWAPVDQASRARNPARSARCSPLPTSTPRVASASTARNHASSVNRRRSSTSTHIHPALPHAQLTASSWPAGLAAADAVLAASAVAASAQAGPRASAPRSTRTDPAVIATAMISHMAPWNASEPKAARSCSSCPPAPARCQPATRKITAMVKARW